MSTHANQSELNSSLDQLFRKVTDEFKEERAKEYGDPETRTARLKPPVLKFIRTAREHLERAGDADAVKYVKAFEWYWTDHSKVTTDQESDEFMQEWFRRRKDNNKAPILRVHALFEKLNKDTEDPLVAKLIGDHIQMMLLDASISKDGKGDFGLMLKAMLQPAVKQFFGIFDRKLGDRSQRKQQVVAPTAAVMGEVANKLDSESQPLAAAYLRAFENMLDGAPDDPEDAQAHSDEVGSLVRDWEKVRNQTPASAIDSARVALARHMETVEKDEVRNMLVLQLHLMKCDADEAGKARPDVTPEEESSPTVLGMLVKVVGTAAFKTYDRVRFILDREIPGGADTVDIPTFVKLCTLNGTQFYNSVADLKREHYKMAATAADTKPPQEKEDPIRKIEREEAVWTALHKRAARFARHRTELLAGLKRELREAGFSEEEIQDMVADFERTFDDLTGGDK
ncbi:MAG: hypothetical protein AB1792_05000 [Candidatus Zixiibacteriota bacterium]